MSNFEKEFSFADQQATVAFGQELGKQLMGGEVIELISDLGGGKTTLTQAIVAGADSSDVVTSPTFTIGKRYSAGKLTIYHFDFYRLQEPGLVAEELAEALKDKLGVIIVEWADSVSEVLPKDRLQIKLSPLADNMDARICNVKGPESMDYLVRGRK